MEEIVLRWIERVGFPIFVSCITMCGMYRLFIRSESISDRNNKALAELAEKSILASGNVATAMSMNTHATQELSETIKKKLGSDPDGLCKAMMAMNGAGFECKADELLKVLQHQKNPRGNSKGE